MVEGMSKNQADETTLAQRASTLSHGISGSKLIDSGRMTLPYTHENKRASLITADTPKGLGLTNFMSPNQSRAAGIKDLSNVFPTDHFMTASISPKHSSTLTKVDRGASSSLQYNEPLSPIHKIRDLKKMADLKSSNSVKFWIQHEMRILTNGRASATQ